jgi:hypothetical protein
MNEFGFGNGNCLQAAIASLLDKKIDELPNFSDFGKEWHRKTSEWLLDHGYGTIWVAAESVKDLIVSDCLCIAVFDTGTHEDHAKVGRWRSTHDYEMEDGTMHWHYTVEEVFDPNPHPNFECVALRGLLLVFRSGLN